MFLTSSFFDSVLVYLPHHGNPDILGRKAEAVYVILKTHNTCAAVHLHNEALLLILEFMEWQSSALMPQQWLVHWAENRLNKPNVTPCIIKQI